MKKTILTIICVLSACFFINSAIATEPKSIGKYKSWESFSYTNEKGKGTKSQATLGISI